MIQCGHCGLYNPADSRECSKCRAALVYIPPKLQKRHAVGPEKAKAVRDNALSALVLGLLIKVYWGGYGPWPVIDLPILPGIRPWVEPVLLYGAALGYSVGWVLNWI